MKLIKSATAALALALAATAAEVDEPPWEG
jgi:hypothetical protein